MGEEIKPLNEYKNDIIVFVNVLDSSKCQYIDQFFMRERHNKLELFCL